MEPIFNYSSLLNSTNSSVNNNTDELAFRDGKRPITWYLQLYITPVIILVGFVGNGLSIIVFVKTRLRHLSSSVYLAALCVADSLFLVQLLAMWLIYLRVFIFHKEGFCQTFVYISYVSAFMSVWFVVSFTVERYIVCIHPLRKQSICRVSRARVIVVVITLLAAVMYNFGAWTSGTVPYHGSRMCIPLTQYRSFTSVLNHVDTVITLIIPSVMIIFMNVRIVLKLSQLSITRTKLIANQDEENILGRTVSNISDNHSVKTQRSMILKSQLKITKMLVSVSSIFIILNLPSHVIRVYIASVHLFNPGLNYDPPTSILSIQRSFQFLYYTNFAINFFLYSLCGKNFRVAFVALFSKLRTNTILSFRSEQNTSLEITTTNTCFTTDKHSQRGETRRVL